MGFAIHFADEPWRKALQEQNFWSTGLSVCSSCIGNRRGVPGDVCCKASELLCKRKRRPSAVSRTACPRCEGRLCRLPVSQKRKQVRLPFVAWEQHVASLWLPTSGKSGLFFSGRVGPMNWRGERLSCLGYIHEDGTPVPKSVRLRRLQTSGAPVSMLSHFPTVPAVAPSSLLLQFLQQRLHSALCRYDLRSFRDEVPSH